MFMHWDGLLEEIRQLKITSGISNISIRFLVFLFHVFLVCNITCEHLKSSMTFATRLFYWRNVDVKLSNETNANKNVNGKMIFFFFNKRRKERKEKNEQSRWRFSHFYAIAYQFDSIVRMKIPSSNEWFNKICMKCL